MLLFPIFLTQLYHSLQAYATPIPAYLYLIFTKKQPWWYHKEPSTKKDFEAWPTWSRRPATAAPKPPPTRRASWRCSRRAV